LHPHSPQRYAIGHRICGIDATVLRALQISASADLVITPVERKVRLDSASDRTGLMWQNKFLSDRAR
jgi:hypothetical protein